MSDVDRLTEQAALLALLRDRKSGWAQIADDVESCGSAYKVLIAEPAGQGDLFAGSPTVAEKLDASRVAIGTWHSEGMQLVTLLDEDYPAQLLTIHERPPFLFFRGRLDPRDGFGVAVVGTRRPSPDGVRRAEEIAAGLAARGTTVISGLAAGIDTAAHTSALDAGGRTVAVIGTGISRAYPPENAQLQRRLGDEHLVLSQFWPDAAPTRHSFPMRNAVMSGYAAATVVIEAAYRSGARMQARMALEHGRPVFLLRSLLAHDWARDYAQRPGTVVVDGLDDVLTALDQVLAPVELVWE
ncbi:MAG TPA: DNA-processing protein DprA [Mycobacteriales bacterium]|nr:DNA-processing protein DprA [Mycobacteriales bacterium]